MLGKLVVTTGISGCGEKEYLEAACSLAASNGFATKKIDLSGQIKAQVKIAKEYYSDNNVLNSDSVKLFRQAALNELLPIIKEDRKKFDVIFLNAHLDFWWCKTFQDAFEDYFMKRLDPDMLITFIDGSEDIYQRLVKREQWLHQDLNSERILLWQNVEVLLTSKTANLLDKPFYVLGSMQPLSTLLNLVFYPEVKTVYISMPITHLQGEEDRQKIAAFISELNKYFVVFDPGAVTMYTESKPEIGFVVDPSVEHQHTVMRDVKWFLGQSNKNIVYFPKIVSSPGAIDERNEAYRTMKDVWVIHPPAASPFMEKYATRKLFNTTAEFFKFLKEEYFKSKPPKLIYSMETYKS